MAIDKYEIAPQGIDELAAMEQDTTVMLEGEPSFVEDADMVVVIDEEAYDAEQEPSLQKLVPFAENLAEYLEEDTLNEIRIDIEQWVADDELSRRDWEDTYKRGLDLLGLKVEERHEPWEGAFGANHPILTEAVVKFQSEAIMETFPAAGPVKTKIIGKETKEKNASSQRVKEEMNYTLTERMPEYRAEHEKLLWSLPIVGSAFKKVYADVTNSMPAAPFVPAEDLIVSYGAADLKSASRYTHRMRKTDNQVLKLQLRGFYRDVELSEATPDNTEVENAKDDQTGADNTNDDRRVLYECHCYLNIPGFEDVDAAGEATGLELPYVVTMDKWSGKVLSIYRNWKEEDIHKQKRIHFSHYNYIPGFGFYGFGLIHLIGSFAKGATSILRQLVDAGTLSNLPGGFKTRGFRIRGGDTPISPGEWRDTDVGTGTLKENILPLPYKEPSLVLAGLLEKIVEEARRFASVADITVSDMSANAPVGSMLAVIERQMKTMSAVQARLHASMKQEFKLIKEIMLELAPEDYDYDAHGDELPGARRTDFEVVEIVPVSDPNASSMSQRIIQYQTVLQMAQTAPEIYDRKHLHRQALEVIGIRDVDKIIPTEADLKPTDPVSENMKLLTGDPVKAFAYQDHEAHIRAHMAFGQDPKIQGMLQQQGPMGEAKVAAGMAHINEHMAFLYRRQIEEQLGVPLPDPDEDGNLNLPEDAEIALSRLVAEAGDRVMGINRQEEQAKQAEQAQNDPVVQQQQRELAIKEAEQQRKDKELDHKINKENKELQHQMIELQAEIMEMESKNQAEGLRLGLDAAKHRLNAIIDILKDQEQLETKGFEQGLGIAREQRAIQQPQPPTPKGDN